MAKRMNKRLDSLAKAAEARRLGTTLDAETAAAARTPVTDPIEDLMQKVAVARARRELGVVGGAAGNMPELPDGTQEFLLTTTSEWRWRR
jgi:hypothetical protein